MPSPISLTTLLLPEAKEFLCRIAGPHGKGKYLSGLLLKEKGKLEAQAALAQPRRQEWADDITVE